MLKILAFSVLWQEDAMSYRIREILFNDKVRRFNKECQDA